MKPPKLTKDPYNIIITGVGGQGNVLASRMLGSILSLKGYTITIGETFGASQRGGSVMSHMRVSADKVWSPQIPSEEADVVISIEPTEALRVLVKYGNSEVKALVNMRPQHSGSVIAGKQKYPEISELKGWIRDLSSDAWFLQATNEAMILGKPIYTNIIMVGALAGVKLLPVERDDFETVVSETMKPDQLEVNLKAFDKGVEMVAA